jgi:hypothetical protein
MIEASMHIPPGYALFIPSAFRKAVDLPVVGVGRFKDPLQAERALAEGHCDLVGVVRGQIADADFAAKARAGATDEIRLCLSCNQECVGRMGLNRWLGCIENPRTGREAEGVGTVSSAEAEVVMVVGAGPAGLQAAIAAARRPPCHRVREGSPGRRPGAPRRQRAQPGRVRRHDPQPAHRVQPPRRAHRVRRRRVARARGRTQARPRDRGHRRRAHSPVVGARRRRARGRRARGARRHAPQPGDVVVVDEIGFHHATSVAELLADRGCHVEIVTPGMVVGQDLGITLDMENWWMRAGAKGIVQSTDLVPMGLAGGELTLLHHPTGANQTRTPTGWCSPCPPNPVEWLYHDLVAAGVSVERVGDCVAPRRAHAAVVDGERAGAAV